MAKELCDTSPEAKKMFDVAADILGYDLLDVCANGPEERLNSTEVSQPAIYVSSMAALEKMKSTPEGQADIDAVDVCAGLSLGEYTALAFAGAFSFEDGLKLVKLRGEAMQAAADAQPSSMAAIIGLTSDKCEELCKAASEQSGKDVRVANYLCKGNYAVSGAVEAIEKVEEIAKPEFKAKMAVRLVCCRGVSHGFHETSGRKVRETIGRHADQRDENTGHFQRRHATAHGRRFNQKDVSDASNKSSEMGRVHAKVDRGRFGKWHGSRTGESHLGHRQENR